MKILKFDRNFGRQVKNFGAAQLSQKSMDSHDTQSEIRGRISYIGDSPQKYRLLQRILRKQIKCARKLDAGGKPSTWLPPGGLVEQFPAAHAKREYNILTCSR